jgi:hypothetical protein
LQEGQPVLLADWEQTVFIHFEVDSGVLQKQIPYELDLFEQRACVSLVAFTMRRLRPAFGGRWLAWISAPAASHKLLNLRTYVRHGDERGIYFITEWVPNLLSRVLGPLFYGLPYRLAQLEYAEEGGGDSVFGCVTAGRDQTRLIFRGKHRVAAKVAAVRPGSLDEFLLERYVGFTLCGPVRRLFRVWHEPWPQVELTVTLDDCSLVVQSHLWFESARYVGAHFSPGVRDVWMGWPHKIQ